LVDIDLVNAQQARRILDRLVGFELSGVLWRKVRGKLSAGRVQSVTVKLIAEKEREIMAFQPTPFYRVASVFNVKNSAGKMVELKADYSSRFDDMSGAKKEFGAEYHKERVYKSKSKDAQEAHEAIRPTDVNVKVATQDVDQQKVEISLMPKEKY